MATGWESLGATLGGGIDREGAYETGRLRTAQTESALGLARQRQLENIALEEKAKARAGLEESLVKSGQSPEKAQLLSRVMVGEMGSDYSAGMTGLAKQQEIDFRSTLGNPEAPLGEQFAAGQGVQGKMLNPYDMMGAGDFVDLRALPAAGETPELGTTPLGQSMIAENDATTNLREVQARDPDYTTVSGGGGSSPGAKNIPTGYMQDPNDPTGMRLIPRPGGPADPNVGPALGVRERGVIARVFNSARQTASDLGNMVEMPSGASIGRLGIGLGATPGSTVMEAVAGNMKLALSPDEVRRYNQTLGGLSIQMRTLEQMGTIGSEGAAAQFDTLQFRPGDTIADKMYKLSIIRQTIENSVGTILSLNRNLPDDAKTWAAETMANAARAVPYTPRDVIELERRQKENPGYTLRQLIEETRAATPASPSAPAAPAASGVSSRPLPKYNAQGWQLLEDAQGNLAYVSPDGKQIEEVTP